MTPRESVITALEGGQPTGRVPHFELVFFLTMEVFGKVHPIHRSYHQWDQMSETERQLHREDIVDVYLQTARTFEHSAIFYHQPNGWSDPVAETIRGLEILRDKAGDDYFTMVHGDSTYGVPGGDAMMEFVEEIAEHPERVKARADEWTDNELAKAERYKAAGVLDGFALCSDYCFNTGPFLSPAMMDEFVFPYLKRLIAGYREMGFYTIKHTDGNIMPILDAMVDCNPHALHSLDPQGGIDMAEIKQRVGDKVCLIGNVNCGLMDTGTEEDVIESARYALKHGMPGSGYIFSTSNCVYTGMALSRYETMLEVWKREGDYS